MSPAVPPVWSEAAAPGSTPRAGTMSKPTITIDKTVHLWWRRWYWQTCWPIGPHRIGSGMSGWTLTRLGARFAAWRSIRRGER